MNQMLARMQEQADQADETLDELSSSMTVERGSEPWHTSADEEELEHVQEFESSEYDEPESDPTAEQLEAMNQRYRTLQGKYNAETATLREQIARIEGQMAAIASRPAEPAVPAKPDYMAYLSDDDVENQGDDVIDLVKRVAQGVAEGERQRMAAELEQKYSARIQNLESAAQQSAGRSFWQQVENAYPGAYNMSQSDAQFHEFLDFRDPLSGMTYRQLGDASLREQDATRMISLYDAYSMSYGESTPSNQKKKVPVSTAKPERVNGSQTMTSSPARETRVYSQHEILTKAAQMAKGFASGRVSQADMDSWEAEIERAVADDRIAM